MSMGLLKVILKEVRDKARCDSCPLKDKSKPLIFEPDCDVRVMVVTYGPNRTEEPEIIESLVNHPTFTYLSALFGGNFRPTENATAYWSHLRKCFIDVVDKNERGKIDRQATEICCKEYLIDEITAVQPELILAVGDRVVKFLWEISEDERLKGNIKGIFMSQKNEMIRNVELKKIELITNVAVVPHPSGRNRFFMNFSSKEKKEAVKILNNIKDNIVKLIS